MPSDDKAENATTKKGDKPTPENEDSKEQTSGDAAATKNESSANNNKSEEAKEIIIIEEEESGKDSKRERSVVKRKRSGDSAIVVEADDLSSPVGKRRRKMVSSAAYKPDDFSEKKPKVAKKGRGDRLRDIPSTKASIEGYKLNSEGLREAYRFLFAGRGGKILPAMRTQLLDFSGYVPDIDDDVDEETAAKIAKEEEAMEVSSVCPFLHV